ncbi:hypothetical protein SLE2022_085200 [Rubroshorea leprosula]
MVRGHIERRIGILGSWECRVITQTSKNSLRRRNNWTRKPQGISSSKWSDQILLGSKATDKGNGCALEGQCIFSEDKHCSPSTGYLCKEGLVYKEAKVCGYSSSSIV